MVSRPSGKGCQTELVAVKIALKVLPYVAGALFVTMWAVGMQVSSELAAIEDSGLSLYHDPVNVQVYWLQSKACIILPPNNYLSKCTYVPGIGQITILTVLLAAVLLAYAIIRRKNTRQQIARWR
jgi:hypothetical protein